MRYVVLDGETTIRNTGEDAVGGFSGSPYSKHNFLVALGELSDDGHERLDYSTTGITKLPYVLRRCLAGVATLIVGHNIAFDLAYMMKTWPEEMEKALPFIHIWDTQQTEYLLSGQTDLYPSLDFCCEKRGLPLKDDEIKELWRQGVDTTLHPKEKLLEYLSGDLHNTHAVYLDQLAQLQNNPALYELVLVKMDDLLMTFQMEWNGMKFDLERAYEKLEAVAPKRAELELWLIQEGKKGFPVDLEFNPGSGDMVSLALFGGTGKYEKRVYLTNEDGSPLVYKGGQKAGQQKSRMEKVEYKVKGLGFKPKKLGIPQLKNGNYSTDSEHLEKLDCEYARKLVEYRELEKDAGTYYEGYSKLVWFDGCIHPRINHESTRTGRQSSSDPNLQNVTKDDE